MGSLLLFLSLVYLYIKVCVDIFNIGSPALIKRSLTAHWSQLKTRCVGGIGRDRTNSSNTSLCLKWTELRICSTLIMILTWGQNQNPFKFKLGSWLAQITGPAQQIPSISNHVGQSKANIYVGPDLAPMDFRFWSHIKKCFSSIQFRTWAI